MEFSVVQRFRCTPEEYWERSRGDAFEQALAAASQVEVEALEPRGAVKRTRVTQIGELPSVAQRALGTKRFCYVQEVESDDVAHATRWSIVPEVMADRVTCSGTSQLSAVADGCERVVRGSLSVRIPIVGGTIERYLGETVERGYEKAESTIRRLVERP
jgi:hypothetical protein